MRRLKMILPGTFTQDVLANLAEQVPESERRIGTQLEFVGLRGGPTLPKGYKASPYDLTVANVFVVEAGVRAAREGFDGVCIFAVSDSGIRELRSLLSIPVVGAGRSALHMACLLGARVSVLCLGDNYKWMFEQAARDEGLEARLVSVRSAGIEVPSVGERPPVDAETVIDALLCEGRRAIEDDGADVLIVGATTMSEFHSPLSSQLPVPIVNPGPAAYHVLEMLLDLKLSHSKIAYPRSSFVDPTVFQRLCDSHFE